jgi:hypothetical protein
MKRMLEPIDLMVVIGVCATVLGGYLVLFSTNSALTAVDRTPPSFGALTEREWVQPVLGQAIVDDATLTRVSSRQTTAALQRLSRANAANRYLNGASQEYIGQVITHAAEVEADHAARVQFVKGHWIVNGTSRGVRTHALTPALLSDGFNRRLIQIAEAIGNRMEAEFRSHREANMEEALETARQVREQSVAWNQERLGHAIVSMTSVQERYQPAQEAAQEQVAAAVLASIRVDRNADLSPRFAEAGQPFQGAPVMQTQPRSWPEIPLAGFIAASVALVGIFLGGLMTPTMPLEAERREEKAYRKTG